MNRPISRCIGILLVFASIVAVQSRPKEVQASSSDISVDWSTPNNAPVSGVFVIEASARTTSSDSSFIKKWCLTLDGSPIATNVALYDFVYSQVRWFGTFDSDTGCWNSASNSMTTAQFEFDSSSWASGSRNFAVTVTDSANRTATSNTLTVNRLAPPTISSPGASTAAVSWNETNNQYEAGPFVLKAQAAGSTSPSSIVRRWCLSVNGSPVSTNVVVPMSGTTTAQNSLAYYGTFNADTGCWSSSSNSLGTAMFQWDSTSWADGSYTFAVTVTDSNNRTASSSTLTVNTVNYAPYTEWSSANNQSITGTLALAGIAVPHKFGTASIVRWCLEIDGSPIKTNVVAPMSGTTTAQNSLAYYSGFDATTGCWINSSNSLVSGMFRLNTAPWTNGTRILKLTVTDSSGRSATDTLSFTTNNPQPTQRLLGVTPGSTAQMTGVFGFEIFHPGASSISNWCVKVNSTECLPIDAGTIKSVSSTSSVSFSLNISMWRNGTYSARATAKDSENRLFDSGPYSFVVSNPGASTNLPKVENNKPKWSDKTVKSTVTFYSSLATEVKVFWGTSPKNLQSWDYQTQGAFSLTFSRLKPKTYHYVKFRATGPNGSSESSLLKFKTASIPPKPKPNVGGGSGGGSSGGSFVRNVVGLRLDIAMRLVSGAYVKQASNCGSYGFENGFWGIQNTSNWIVVAQSSRTLYACKK